MMNLLDALKFIDLHGSLIDAPCSDDDVRHIFRELYDQNWIFRHKGKLRTTKLGVEVLLRAKPTT